MVSQQEAISLVPAGYDIAFTVLALAALIALGAGLVVWFRDQRSLGEKFVALVLMLLIPLLGPVAYVIGRRGMPEGA